MHAAATLLHSDLQHGTLFDRSSPQEVLDRVANGENVDPLPPLPLLQKVGGGHASGARTTLRMQAAHRTYDRLCLLGYTSSAAELWRGERPRFSRVSWKSLDEMFHWDDVPAEVRALERGLRARSRRPLRNDPLTPLPMEVTSRIDVPVLLCLGERDISPAPEREREAFPACEDFTLFTLPRSGHAHTFATTRPVLFDRVTEWNAARSGTA
jgi:pimeloyl-ACP methyl ester carboxylesterase